uniref:Neurotransmitter-gated ion-channel transmembrane domain-containing protein n=1 Tax=Leptobrachium leishanense TaxID=445787 RepID=A0A8C5M4N2_9ANUR
MLIDILSFYLPPHSTDRSSFKMTLLLGYTVFLLIMNDLLPSTANGTPLIGIYFSVCLALLVLSLLETVIITHVLHRGSLESGSVPTWVKRLVLGCIAKLICYRVTISPDSMSGTHCGERGVPELLPPDALSPGPERQLALINQNLQTVKDMMESKNHLQDLEEEWVQIGNVLDSLLYRLYLIFIGAYAIIITSVWCIWYNM